MIDLHSVVELHIVANQYFLKQQVVIMFLQICCLIISVDLLCEATQIEVLSLCHSNYVWQQNVQRTINMYFLLPAIVVCKCLLSCR